MSRRALLPLASMAWLFALGAWLSPAVAQQAGCDEGQIIGQRPDQNARLVVCSSVARKVPELEAKIDRLSAVLQQSGDKGADVQRFVKDINVAAQRLNGQQDKLAGTIAQLLKARDADSDQQVARQLAGLALQLEDVEDKIDKRANDPATARPTQEALEGAMGAALAKLDFPAVNKMADDLGEIKKSLSRIESNTTPACVSDPDNLKMTQDDVQRSMASLQSEGAEQRCALGFAGVRTILDTATKALRQGDLGGACRRYDEVKQRAGQIEAELSTAEFEARTAAMQAEKMQVLAERRQTLDRNTYSTYLDMATNGRHVAATAARTATERGELADADQLIAKAQAEASADRFDLAVIDIQDANHFVNQIKQQDLGSLDPNVPIAVTHSPAATRRDTAATPLLKARMPGALCSSPP